MSNMNLMKYKNHQKNFGLAVIFCGNLPLMGNIRNELTEPHKTTNN